jgi:hypothetical protein
MDKGKRPSVHDAAARLKKPKYIEAQHARFSTNGGMLTFAANARSA